MRQEPGYLFNTGQSTSQLEFESGAAQVWAEIGEREWRRWRWRAKAAA